MRAAASFLALCFGLAAFLVGLAGLGPQEAPEPTPTPTQETTPEPTPEPTPTIPGTIIIPMPEEFDGDLDSLLIGIPVEGMPTE